jgi:hypothetical protein
MQRGKRSSDDVSAGAAASSSALAMLKSSVIGSTAPDQFCTELSRIFQVLATEVALFRAEDGQLKFLFPNELQTAGSLPLSSGSAIASHTAITRKAERYNKFLQVKHASIFETVKLGHLGDNTPPEKPIQKLMSAPILDAQGAVLGVIQICRKGYDLISSGPDFTLDQLHQLERAASLATQAAFMQNSEPLTK